MSSRQILVNNCDRCERDVREAVSLYRSHGSPSYLLAAVTAAEEAHAKALKELRSYDDARKRVEEKPRVVFRGHDSVQYIPDRYSVSYGGKSGTDARVPSKSSVHMSSPKTLYELQHCEVPPAIVKGSREHILLERMVREKFSERPTSSPSQSFGDYLESRVPLGYSPSGFAGGYASVQQPPKNVPVTSGMYGGFSGGYSPIPQPVAHTGSSISHAPPQPVFSSRKSTVTSQSHSSNQSGTTTPPGGQEFDPTCIWIHKVSGAQYTFPKGHNPGPQYANPYINPRR
jgi:hypothetical protein